MIQNKKHLPPHGKHVLITGASTGLGLATALHLAEQGFQVLSGVRNEEDGAKVVKECRSGRMSSLLIDVTDERSIASAADRVSEIVGERGLWGLINNAGICISAPLECVSSDLLRKQLEVNLIGQLAVTRAFLPLLRKSRHARLVNVTSGLGTVAVPYLGAYSAAQFAKEAMSDALRRELAPMDIAVSVVSPGAIWTPIWAKIAAEGERVMATAPAAVSDLYRETYLRFLNANEQSARNSKTTPAHVAAAVYSALTADKPKTRYRVGADVRRGSLLARLLPDAVIDKMFRQIVTPVIAEKESHHVRS
jgi:NAD(P)-dependent dehydrogenase (short-subunit alcohol dehydrogenase family)